MFVAAFISSIPLAQPAFAAGTLAINPTTLNFGQLPIGRVKTISVYLKNTGTSNAMVSSIRSSLWAYTVHYPTLPITLRPGQSVSLSIAFGPIVIATDNATVSVNGTALLTIKGSAVADPIVANPQSVIFGNVQEGSTATKTVTMTNKTAGNLTITSDSITSTMFHTQGLTLPLTVGPGQSYTFKIAFLPKLSGNLAGWFKAFNGGSTTLAMIQLVGSGTAAGLLNLSPTSAAFGNVNVGSTSSKTGTLTASGASVTISSASSSSSEFLLSGISLPKTLAAGQSASYTVTFKPQSSGTASAKVAFASNASDSVAESLSGTGVATTQPPPASYTVSLTWNASTSSIAGYNVYRGIISGGPYSKLNSALEPATAYTDGTVAASKTYYYVTTAVNSTGQESKYSNQVQVVIP